MSLVLRYVICRFDPLRLGSNKDFLPWFKEAELTNGRWAMMAIPGILAIEALGKADPWWNAGATVSLQSCPAHVKHMPGMHLQGWKTQMQLPPASRLLLANAEG